MIHHIFCIALATRRKIALSAAILILQSVSMNTDWSIDYGSGVFSTLNGTDIIDLGVAMYAFNVISAVIGLS